MGEAKRRRLALQEKALEAMVVNTPGGRIQVQWDMEASASPNAQLTFFAEYLATTGIYDEWVKSCPLTYTSPNAHSLRNVLGTLMLAILAGHKRYAHITGLRGDALSAKVLGMKKIVSEDAMRRALSRMDAQQSQDWLCPHLLNSVQAASHTPWILDIDTTIKPLFGKQSGAEVGYNPHKPGRPSHAYHTYWMSNLRLVLDVVVSAGKAHSAAHARPGLLSLLCRKTQSEQGEQLEILMPDNDVQAWEYVVLVTNSDYPLEAYGQLYRDRADCENGFDEIKNQWGWGGFTTQDIERCQTCARVIALVYNWWSWYCRAAKPGARMEAQTSRALLLAGVGRAVEHGRQTTVYLTPMHAAKDTLIALVNNVQEALRHVKAVAEQLPKTDRWKTFLDYVVAKITRPLLPWIAPESLAPSG